MSNIHIEGKQYTSLDNESVLDALLRQGVNVPHSCKSGNCLTCMLKTDSLDLPENCISKLPSNLHQQGYFLPCICITNTTINILPNNNNELFYSVRVVEYIKYNQDVCCIRLERPEGFAYKTGQIINIAIPNENRLIRSYSIASQPQRDAYIEVHVRRKLGGAFSNWLNDNLKIGDTLKIQGPQGNFIYSSPPQRKLLLIGTGTGISPLYGIISEALYCNHTGEIHIFYGSHNHTGLYLQQKLQSLVDENANIYLTCTLSGKDKQTIQEEDKITPGRANDIALKTIKDLNQFDIYLCGNPGMVKATQMQTYLAGALMSQIFIDAFEYKGT
ncbi:FAD-binding oxidoreductase [Shewanella aestuarii]|uniref:2Fe-2S iron-sulfur cluster binding domain-containing protein n=1 Tax=Shewanella aestuarii TaxID=1028752 RepID=A0A6G9QNG1_9GAMM|nr:2Fe-2S iron-sulfur cluster binding domain-containing protein [Shewanella aestuarii]QIR16022.1 2Fe-2S iron-sulfur cluster binding domain-containing protein [Shewanella aestuarii]